MANEATKKEKTNADPIAQIDPFLTIDAFLALKDVQVELTYPFLAEKIVIPCKLILDEDQLQARQKFYALPAGEQKAGEHNYHVEMLAAMISGVPSGLPGFVELFVELFGKPENKPNADELAGAVRTYFQSETELSKKIVADAVDRYAHLTSPLEFFR
jgi:hypothetical protein